MVQARLRRLENWRGRLSDEMADIYSAPFNWGSHDCIIGLGRRVVKALTGEDLMDPWPTYSSEKEAARVLRDMGFASLPLAVASFLPEIPKFNAQVGDLALFRTNGLIGYALGMVNTSTVLVVTPDGIGHRTILDAVSAFQVGEL